MSNFLEVEILRGKNYPQAEDDPNPCTTQIRASLFNTNLAVNVAAEQCSSMQENSNSPFYKDLVVFEIPDSIEAATLLLKVVEFSRKNEPFTILYGVLNICMSEFKVKHEVTVYLTASSPTDQPENPASELVDATELGDKSPSLNMRIHLQKCKGKTDGEDPNADVQIRPGLVMDGSCTLVPTDSHYVWLRLVNDKKWVEAFSGALIAFLNGGGGAATEPPLGTKKTRRSTKLIEKTQSDIRNIGDVVLRRWNCCRLHQILTRVRITAEKYAKGVTKLCFTSDEERQYRTEKKERAFLLNEMCQESLSKSTGNNLRDWLDRLWVLFAIGIDNDPSGPRTLSYDVRKQVHEAQFFDDDAVILQSCLLYFLVPTVPFDVCQSISEEDYRSPTVEANVSSPQSKAKIVSEWAPKVSIHQRYFTKTIITVFGPMMDTLTEAELLRMTKIIKPAVWDANQRIKKGGKAGIKSRISGVVDAYIPRGEGIPIDHLDKLGRRKKSNKFA